MKNIKTILKIICREKFKMKTFDPITEEGTSSYWDFKLTKIPSIRFLTTGMVEGIRGQGEDQTVERICLDVIVEASRIGRSSGYYYTIKRV